MSGFISCISDTFAPGKMDPVEKILCAGFGVAALVMSVAFAIFGVPMIHCVVGGILSIGLVTSALTGARGYFYCASILAFGLTWASAIATGSLKVHTWVEYT